MILAEEIDVFEEKPILMQIVYCKTRTDWLGIEPVPPR